MAEFLYRNGYIQKDKIGAALHSAKYRGLLGGLDDVEVRSFLEGFDRAIAERRVDFRDNIDHNEMRKILGVIMQRDKSDKVNDRDLDTISKVLLDKNFKF